MVEYTLGSASNADRVLVFDCNRRRGWLFQRCVPGTRFPLLGEREAARGADGNRRKIGEPKVSADSLPDFAGKVVSLYHTHKPDDDGAILCDPHFERQGARLFLIGTPAPGTTVNDWLDGKTIAVAWDTIDEYYLFDSLQDYVECRTKGWTEVQDEDGNPRFEPI